MNARDGFINCREFLEAFLFGVLDGAILWVVLKCDGEAYEAAARPDSESDRAQPSGC